MYSSQRAHTYVSTYTHHSNKDCATLKFYDLLRRKKKNSFPQTNWPAYQVELNSRCERSTTEKDKTIPEKRCMFPTSYLKWSAYSHDTT